MRSIACQITQGALSKLSATAMLGTAISGWAALGAGGSSGSSFPNPDSLSTTNRITTPLNQQFPLGQSSGQTNALPNFVVFIADDHGARDLGAYGNEATRTPNLDQLAREGMRFTQAFLTSASGQKNRASILSGRYPHNLATNDQNRLLASSQQTLAYYLRNSGYYCAAIGKWHLSQNAKTNSAWHAVSESPGGLIADETITIFQNRPKDKPFFLWIASEDPHRPYKQGSLQPPHDPAEVEVPPYLPDHPSIRRELALYYDEISRFDSKIGLIRKEMATSGALDNTVILYLSDNGKPFPRAKTTLYDSGIRTPMIVWWPGNVPAGTVQRHLVSSIDIAPTLLAIARSRQDSMQGKNIFPMWQYPYVSARQAVYTEANGRQYEKFTRSVRTRRFKLIRNYYWDSPLWHAVDFRNSDTWQGMLEMKAAGRLTRAQAKLFRSQRPFEEFYDLAQDPFELRNALDEEKYRRRRNHLRTLLDNWRVQTRDRMPQQRRPARWTTEQRPITVTPRGREGDSISTETNRFGNY